MKTFTEEQLKELAKARVEANVIKFEELCSKDEEPVLKHMFIVAEDIGVYKFLNELGVEGLDKIFPEVDEE